MKNGKKRQTDLAEEDKAALLSFFGDVIITELMKPEGQADMSLVHECERFTSKLLAADSRLSKRKVKNIIKGINDRVYPKIEGASFGKKRKMFPRVAGVVCAAIVTLSIGVTALIMIDPSIQEGVMSVLKSKGIIERDGITFMYGGKETVYSSVDELLEDISWDIIFPRNWPNGLILREISVTTANRFRLCASFDDENIKFDIYEDIIIEGGDYESGIEVISVGNRNFDISNIDDVLFIATTCDDGYVYQFSCTDRDMLILLINCFE